MERLALEVAGQERGPKGSRQKKRKWREIESIQERFRLKKELQDIDWAHDLELDDLEI
ncbi:MULTISPECIES: DUF3545 family protein [Corallincola]|uniref:DUF3545 family protein n=3 Tax=Corallincola TaxID=1775176 RepID=A0A368NQ54_9GAMM|nr:MULTISPECIES: DUF3545 family protein [Corallincola]RCU51814.1 DUF3545 family protein [Corallincola holothuriorum]TAA47306.1 DUF3545 family protein [Corallincola spongiicola]TCI04967.1 DUF3545 family protein [Corallincola luteus]